MSIYALLGVFVFTLVVMFALYGIGGAVWLASVLLFAIPAALGSITSFLGWIGRGVFSFLESKGEMVDEWSVARIRRLDEQKVRLRAGSRREILIRLVIAVMLFGGGAYLLTRTVGSAAEVSAARTSDVTLAYPMRDLANVRFGGLLAYYTGISGVVPDTAHINFCSNLRTMWERKVLRSLENRVVSETANEIVSSYCSSTPSFMTARDYQVVVDRIVVQARSELDWDAVARIEGLNARQLQLVRNIANSLTGNAFLAYALTELMPTTDGRLNLQVFDFLIRNGGREYIEKIPALHDPYTSFGPYQFTQYAWYESGSVRRGASRINRALRSPIAHGSVSRLRGDEHHVAALLLAVHNLSYTVSRLNGQQLATLEREWRQRHTDVVQFIATAHNAPYGARGAQGAFSRWLSAGAPAGQFSRSLALRRLIGYSHKTRANLIALGE